MTFKEPRNFDIFIASEYLKSKKDKTEFIPAQSFVVWFWNEWNRNKNSWKWSVEKAFKKSDSGNSI